MKLRNKENEYHIGNCACGELLPRVIIQEAHLDTNASLRRIPNAIQWLPEYMATVKNDIKKFNLCVEDLISQLAARGAILNELLTNLFNAY